MAGLCCLSVKSARPRHSGSVVAQKVFLVWLQSLDGRWNLKRHLRNWQLRTKSLVSYPDCSRPSVYLNRTQKQTRVFLLWPPVWRCQEKHEVIRSSASHRPVVYQADWDRATQSGARTSPRTEMKFCRTCDHGAESILYVYMTKTRLQIPQKQLNGYRRTSSKALVDPGRTLRYHALHLARRESPI